MDQTSTREADIERAGELAKAAHPGKEIHALDALPAFPDWILVRAPEEGEWNIYRQKMAEKDVGADKMIVQVLAVYPELKEVKAILAAHPGLAQTWAAEIREIAGIVTGDHRRKL